MNLTEWFLTVSFIIFVIMVIRHSIMNYRSDNTMMHYYMFTVEEESCIVYLSTKEKIKPENMNAKRLEVGKRFDLSEEASLNIGVSYIGCFSEREMTQNKK